MRDYKKPIFTSKHYETIVDLLAEIKVNRRFTENTILEELKDLFESDNPRFKIDRFINKYDQLVKQKTEETWEEAKKHI